MDMNDILEFLRSAMRSVGAEVTSPWFYLQFGLVLAGAGISLCGRRRDPRAGRHDLARDALAGAAAALLRVLVGTPRPRCSRSWCAIARVVMKHSTWPSRSYLLAVAAKLALAWLVIRLLTSVIRNAFIVRLVSLAAWLVAALSIIGQLDPTIEALDSVSIVFGGLRLTPLLLIKLGVLLSWRCG